MYILGLSENPLIFSILNEFGVFHFVFLQAFKMKTYIDAVLHNAWLLFYLFLFLATIVAERDNTGSGKKSFFFWGGGLKQLFSLPDIHCKYG